MGIRASLGAGRGRLIRQLLAESLILAGLGGVVGVLVAFLATNAAAEMLPATIAFDLNPDASVVGFVLLLSALAHLTVVSPGVFGWYVGNLKKGINYARWYEYSLSASLMIVLIGMLCGVCDLGALLWHSC